MKKVSYLTIPCHWDKQVLERILRQKSGCGVVLKETYGVIPRAPIGHGRNPFLLKSLKKEEIYAFRALLKKNKINFAYVLNSPVSKKEIQKNHLEVKKYVKWILEKVEPDSLIISSLEIMKIVRELSNIPITISAISRIKNPTNLKKYLKIKPSKVIVQHDTNRNFKELRELVQFTKKNDIKIEVMLTESCRRRCPLMVGHYKTVGKGNSDKSFHQRCNLKKISSPEELLLANFIRPEDMSLYEGVGINHFKITGRSKKSIWLPEVVNAYRNRKFRGNLMRLLGIDPCLNAEEWIYLSNLALEGFLKGFPRESSIKKEREYCKKWIKKLYYDGNFWVSNLEYNDSKGTLAPNTPVEKLPQIKHTYSN